MRQITLKRTFIAHQIYGRTCTLFKEIDPALATGFLTKGFRSTLCYKKQGRYQGCLLISCHLTSSNQQIPISFVQKKSVLYRSMEMIAEIQNCEQTLLQAIKENDIEMLDHLLHKDLLFVNPMGQIITKAIDMANYRTGQITIDLIAASDQIINLINNIAIVTVQIKLKGKYLEHSLNENFQYLRVWTKQKGTWKIIGGSCVKLLRNVPQPAVE